MRSVSTKGRSRAVAALLCVVMLLGMIPAGAFAAGGSTNAFYKIVHLDAGRKYFSVENIKKIIDTMDAAGYNQLELYLSDNQGFRFALDDMVVTPYGAPAVMSAPVETSAPVESAPAETGAPVETSAPVESAPAETGAPVESAPAETGAPVESAPAETSAPVESAPAETGAPAETSAPVESEPVVSEPEGSTSVENELSGTQPVVSGTTSYNLAEALGDGYSDGGKYPDGSGQYLTQSEMDEIIDYANRKGIEIVPCINTPGHMGAILEEFPQFRYSGSKSSIDLGNAEAVAFALGIVDKYAEYFAGQGVEYFNIGADEYANDLTTMGFAGLYRSGEYPEFADYLNAAAGIIKEYGMTPRAFNDGIYYNNDTSYAIDPDIQVCYWSSGWSGYDVASASTIAGQGHAMINTHGDYYWVLGNSSWQCSANKAAGFDYTAFQGGTISDPAGAMFCIWCDVGSADGQDDGAGVVSRTADVITAFGAALPSTDFVVPLVPTEPLSGPPAVGDAFTLIPSLDGYDFSDLRFTSSDESVATVGPDTGLVTCVGQGSATITVTGTATRNAALLSRASDTVNGESFTSTYDLTVRDAVEAAETREITVAVGATAADTIADANYAGSYTTGDESIATVTVTGTDGSESTTNYGEAHVTYNDLLGRNSTRASTGYYVKVGESYYPLYATRTSSGIFSITYTYTWYYSTDNGSSFTQYGNQERTQNTFNTPSITVYRASGSAAVPASTTVTFTGHSAGTTSVVIGNVQYIITVTPEDLSFVTPQTVEFWITNRRVTTTEGTSMAIYADAPGVYSEDGALFRDLVPATGTSDGNGMVFWKGTRLDSSHTQTTTSLDQTKSGTDFTRIRYWDGAWAYSGDGTAWTNVAYGDQIVAYYLQKTDVTTEVETQVVDWGVVPSTSYNSSNFVLVDFAVKYESGEQTPSAFPVAKTMAFHCDPNATTTVHQYGGDRYTWYHNYREIGMIRAEETEDYEVYMITVRATNDNQSTQVASNAQYATSYAYNGIEKVVWVDDPANLGDFADESLRYTNISGEMLYKEGGDPVVPGLEIFNRHGMLVTYYVRTKATEDSLTVRYVDQTADAEFYSYHIAVAGGTLFDAGIGLGDPWKGDLVHGAVTNLQGKTQTVSADLDTMPAIGAQYRYSGYTCVRVERSEDGKTVSLYYTFGDNAASFVMDYGLPLTITPQDLGLTGGWTSVTVSGARYGTAEVAVGEGLVYTPTEILQGVERLTLTLTDDTGPATHTIYIYPATTVYYEENVVETTGSVTAMQNTARLGSDSNNYGFDDAYAGFQNISMGGSRTITASGELGSTAPKAEFTFTGTGFDLISETARDSAAIFVTVKDSSGAVVGQHMVYNYYGLEYQADGTWTQKDNGTLYQIPVMRVTGLDHGTYTVTVEVPSIALLGGGNVDFVLDAVRIYDTLSPEPAGYASDGENAPKYYEVRDLLLEAYADKKDEFGTVTIDGKDTGVTYDEYQQYGPNNEVYLSAGQSVSIPVAVTGTPADVQLGLRLASGTTGTVTVNEKEIALDTATDLYYTISLSDTLEIHAGEGNAGMISVTTLKVTGGATVAAQ